MLELPFDYMRFSDSDIGEVKKILSFLFEEKSDYCITVIFENDTLLGKVKNDLLEFFAKQKNIFFISDKSEKENRLKSMFVSLELYPDTLEIIGILRRYAHTNILIVLDNIPLINSLIIMSFAKQNNIPIINLVVDSTNLNIISIF